MPANPYASPGRRPNQLIAGSQPRMARRANRFRRQGTYGKGGAGTLPSQTGTTSAGWSLPPPTGPNPPPEKLTVNVSGNPAHVQNFIDKWRNKTPEQRQQWAANQSGTDKYLGNPQDTRDWYQHWLDVYRTDSDLAGYQAGNTGNAKIKDALEANDMATLTALANKYGAQDFRRFMNAGHSVYNPQDVAMLQKLGFNPTPWVQKGPQDFLNRMNESVMQNWGTTKMQNAFSGPGSESGPSPEIIDYLAAHPNLATRVEDWYNENKANYAPWGKTIYGDIGANGVWDQGEFSGQPGIQSAMFSAFPRLQRVYNAAAGPQEPGMGRGSRPTLSSVAPTGAGPQTTTTGVGVVDAMKAQAAAAGLPLTPEYEAQMRLIEDQLSASLASIGVAREQIAPMVKLMMERMGTQQGIDTEALQEGLVDRGIYDSGTTTRDWSRLNADYARQAQDLGLQSAQQYSDLAAQEGQAYLNYQQQMIEALIQRAIDAAQNVPLGIDQTSYAIGSPNRNRRRLQRRKQRQRERRNS